MCLPDTHTVALALCMQILLAEEVWETGGFAQWLPELMSVAGLWMES